MGLHEHETASWLLDWRFLLTDPSFGRTLVLGKAPRDREPMLSALGRATDVSGRRDHLAPVDGAVLFGTDAADVATASHAVREGGWIYVEIRRFGRPSRPSALGVSLRRAGFTRLCTYWHWPTFAACREIVPLDDRAAVRASLVRRSRTGLRSVPYRAAGALERLGLFEAFAPHISISGIRESGG